MRRHVPNSWQSVARQMRLETTPSRWTWNKRDMPHPREAGARSSASLLVGQLADYRFGPETGCHGLHIQEFSDHWVAWLDSSHEAANPFANMATDSDATIWLGCGLAGAAAGAALGKKGGAILAGAGIGLLVAALLANDKKK